MKKLIISIVILLLVSTMSACGGEPNSTEEPFDIIDFKNTITLYNADIMEQSLLLSNMGSYEFSYLEAYESVSGRSSSNESLIESALDWLEKNSGITGSDLEDSHSRINSQYEELRTIELPDEAQEIFDAYVELVNDYNAIYKVVLSPSMSSQTFAKNLLEALQNVQESGDALAAILS